jgi:hypothetical protein
MKQRKEVNVTTQLPTTGDPSAIAMRVDRILEIVQIRGVFERLPSTEVEVLVPEFRPIQATGKMLSDSELGIRLVFGFVARVEQKDDSQATDAGGDVSGANHDIRVFVEAAFLARYALGPGECPDAADVQKFAEVNGKVNLTPYWREFLDSAFRRAGLPPIYAPVAKAPKQSRGI